MADSIRAKVPAREGGPAPVASGSLPHTLDHADDQLRPRNGGIPSVGEVGVCDPDNGDEDDGAGDNPGW